MSLALSLLEHWYACWLLIPLCFLVFVRRDVFEQDFMNLNERESFFLWWYIWPVCLQKSLWCLYEECMEYIIDSDRNVEKRDRDRKKKTVSEMTRVFSSRLWEGLCMCLYVGMLASVVVHLWIRRFQTHDFFD